MNSEENQTIQEPIMETPESIAEDYLSSLQDLNLNSKPLINMLTILADDNINHADVIVGVIKEHIIKKKDSKHLNIKKGARCSRIESISQRKKYY
uniref:CID domain-containing protein n=1 Tax=Megaselia scalaris TaxID=36166 RepID=T1GPX4_MEGSC